MAKFPTVLLLYLSFLCLSAKAQIAAITGVPSVWNLSVTYELTVFGGLPPFNIWVADVNGNNVETLATNTGSFIIEAKLNPLAGGAYTIVGQDVTMIITSSPAFSIPGPVCSYSSIPASTTTVTVISIQTGGSTCLLPTTTSSCPTITETLSCPTSSRPSSTLPTTCPTITETLSCPTSSRPSSTATSFCETLTLSCPTASRPSSTAPVPTVTLSCPASLLTVTGKTETKTEKEKTTITITDTKTKTETITVTETATTSKR